MKPFLCALCCLSMTLGLFANQEHGQWEKNIAKSDAVEGERSFSCALLSSAQQTGNFAYSPYSLYVVLSVLRDGARGNTADEISKAMNLSSSNPSFAKDFTQIQKEISHLLIGKDSFVIANALWVRSNATILPNFQKLMVDGYNATVQTLNFADQQTSANIINDWAALNTEGKIKNFMQPRDIYPNTQMIITNTTFLKAQWLNPFDQNLTRTSSFFPTNGSSVTTPMMNNSDWFYYYEDETVQCAALPFRSPQSTKSLDFYLILPKSAEQLDSLQTSLTSDQLHKWMEESKLDLVQISMPKFTLCYEANVNAQLKQLGMTTAYSSAADFSGIDGSHNLMLNDVVQKVVVEVDESGVIAAAATRGSIGLKSVRESIPPKIFRANRPFLFFIADDVTHSILFMGRLETPQVQPCE